MLRNFVGFDAEGVERKNASISLNEGGLRRARVGARGTERADGLGGWLALVANGEAATREFCPASGQGGTTARAGGGQP